MLAKSWLSETGAHRLDTHSQGVSKLLTRIAIIVRSNVGLEIVPGCYRLASLLEQSQVL